MPYGWEGEIMDKTSCAHCDNKSLKIKKACKTKGTNKPERFYICEDCGAKSLSAESVCRPKETLAAYVCKKCGSPGVSKKSVCKPKAV